VRAPARDPDDPRLLGVRQREVHLLRGHDELERLRVARRAVVTCHRDADEQGKGKKKRRRETSDRDWNCETLPHRPLTFHPPKRLSLKELAIFSAGKQSH
jgi:hypothetical protein